MPNTKEMLSKWPKCFNHVLKGQNFAQSGLITFHFLVLMSHSHIPLIHCPCNTGFEPETSYRCAHVAKVLLFFLIEPTPGLFLFVFILF